MPPLSLRLVLCSVFAAFLATPALADTCRNANLLEELKDEDPALYAEIRAAADDIPNSQGLFWEITGNGLDTSSWLFGTVHKADPRVTNLPTNVTEALENVDQVIGELKDPSDTNALASLMITRSELILMPPEKSLTDLLEPETVDTLKEFLKERGSHYGRISRLRPWLASAALSMSVCDVDNPANPQDILDTKILLMGAANGAEVRGLETLERQLEAIASMGEAPAISDIETAAELYRAGIYDDMLQTLLELYIAEEVAVYMPLAEHVLDIPEEDMADYTRYMEELVDIRNAEMVEKLDTMLQEKPAFVAVGALHLPGENGLIEALRAKGYTLTRVELER